MERIDGIISEWESNEFYQALPHLRLAFSQHTPLETDRVAKLVSKFAEDESEIEDWYQRSIPEAFLNDNISIAQKVSESLKRDRLLDLYHESE